MNKKTMPYFMKTLRGHARSIFSFRFVGSKIPKKRKLIRTHPKTNVRGLLRRGIKFRRIWI